MNLKHIGVMSLSACALLLASCAKSLSRDQAIEFVKEHYNDKPDTQEVTKQHVKVYGDSDSEAGKEIVKQTVKEVTGESALSGEKEITYEEGKGPKFYKITEAYIREDIYSNLYTYSSNGNELTIKLTTSIEQGTYFAKDEAVGLYNENGVIKYYKKYSDINIDSISYNITVEITYTY